MSDPEHAADRPATFREVLASGEFRAIYSASALSSLGDSMARAAVTALVYQQTESVFFAGATFAISYLPWLGAGTVLAAVAERYPYRRTMVVCDLARMVTIALVAMPGIPLPVVLALLFITALFDPPFKAARSALTPRVLHGDRYVVGLSLMETTAQIVLISGYFIGGTLAGYSPRLTVLFDAATFGISACIVGLWVHHREAALRRERRTHLLRETADGFRVVFGGPVLRAIAIVVFGSMLFAVVPEGLGAAWAGEFTSDHRERGWIQGLIMCSTPVGFIIGSVSINRFVIPSARQRMIRVFAVLVPLSLVGALFNPPVIGVAAVAGACGFAVAAMLPAANGLFVQALPNEYRARAFGVMQSGVQLAQGASVFVTGYLASHFRLPLVVGLWGVAGAALMLLAALTWPSRNTIAHTVAQTQAMNDASTADLAEPGQPAQPAESAGGGRGGPRDPRGPHDPGGNHGAGAVRPGAASGGRHSVGSGPRQGGGPRHAAKEPAEAETYGPDGHQPDRAGQYGSSPGGLGSGGLGSGGLGSGGVETGTPGPAVGRPDQNRLDQARTDLTGGGRHSEKSKGPWPGGGGPDPGNPRFTAASY